MTLPPVMQIAFDEELSSSDSPQALKRRITSDGLLQELERQGAWSLEQYEYADSRALTTGEISSGPEFSVTPAGTLNPFSPVGKCFGQGCFGEITEEFNKTVGLYTEVAVIPDPLTTFFTGEAERDNEAFEVLFRHLKVLEKIAPLLEYEVLRVATPMHSYCIDCKRETEKVLEEATEEIIAGISAYKAGVYGTKEQGFYLGFELPILQPEHTHPILRRSKISNSEAAVVTNTLRTRSQKSKAGRKLLRKLLAKAVQRELDTIFFELDTARRLDSLLLAGSRSEALVISTLDKAAPPVSEIEDWEKMRTVSLPWIQKLTCDEVLALREQAGKALPRLRELLRSQLIVPTDNNKRMDEVVAELRSQALEVEAELDALNLPKERRFRAGMSGLAMSFVIYAFASQSPQIIAGGLVALLATLAHLRNTERDHDAQATKSTSKPAYALLKAKQIIQNRTRV